MWAMEQVANITFDPLSIMKDVMAESSPSPAIGTDVEQWADIVAGIFAPTPPPAWSMAEDFQLWGMEEQMAKAESDGAVTPPRVLIEASTDAVSADALSAVTPPAWTTPTMSFTYANSTEYPFADTATFRRFFDLVNTTWSDISHSPMYLMQVRSRPHYRKRGLPSPTELHLARRVWSAATDAFDSWRTSPPRGVDRIELV
jgi:hypothetical protein